MPGWTLVATARACLVNAVFCSRVSTKQNFRALGYPTDGEVGLLRPSGFSALAMR
jgi:hypothetical protein